MEYTSFREFSKRFWWLYLSLAAILVGSVALFCIIFRKELSDVSAWASMIAGIATYIGSSFLGVVVFYNSWIQVQIQEKSNEVRLSIEQYTDFNDNYFVPFAEESIDRATGTYSYRVATKSTEEFQCVKFNYLQLEITNLTNTVPIDIKIEGLYFVNSQNCVEKAKTYSVVSDFRFDQSPLDYKQKVTAFVGLPSNILAMDYYNQHKYFNCFVVLKVSTFDGRIQYEIVDYVLGKTFDQSKKTLSSKIYAQRCDKNGMPIVLTKYNKQFFRKQD